MKAPNEKFRAYLFQSLCARERGGGWKQRLTVLLLLCPVPPVNWQLLLSVSPSFFPRLNSFLFFSGFSKREFNPCYSCGRYYGESGLFVPGGVNPLNPFSNRLSC